MGNFKLGSLLLSMIIILVITSNSVKAQNVNIPDTAFLTALLNNPAINTNADGFIQVSEANAYTGSIDVSNVGISDLTGIEAFTLVDSLNATFNQITYVDLSNNTLLVYLSLGANQLTAIDLSNNIGLKELVLDGNNLTTISISYCPDLELFYINNNQISSLNVADNPNLITIAANGNVISSINTNACSNLKFLGLDDNLLNSININGNLLLEELFVNNNQLNNLNLSNNTALTTLECGSNNLSNLVLTSNTLLTYLSCPSNGINALDLSNNINLEYLNCEYNVINNLDVTACTILNSLQLGSNQVNNLNITNNTALASLTCENNQLVSLDVSANVALSVFMCAGNQLTNLNMQNGNNNLLTYFWASQNPALTCVQVDDILYMTSNWPNAIDATASYSLACAGCTVTIPDNNFKNALLNNALVNTNSNTEIECSEAASFNGFLEVIANNISDLTGIEAFVNITGLNCSANQLTVLDISNNTALTDLRCVGNQLTSLSVSNNVSLTKLWCWDNNITSLNLIDNPNIDSLECSNNQLTSLDLSSNAALRALDCSFNQISSLDLSSNNLLSEIGCANNILTSLNIQNGNNSNLTYFYAPNNPALNCILVDDAAFMNSNWSSGINGSTVFSTTCGACTVNIPDVIFKNALLANTAINTNSDTEIQCSEAIAYNGYINVSNLNISDLTGIEAFVNIDSLNCGSNSLYSLDLSSNTALIYIQCYGNQITSLNITGLSSLQVLYCYLNNLTSIDVSSNTALTLLNCNANQLTSLNVDANTALTSLGCGSNQLTSINISNNILLTSFGCDNNNINSLNIQSNTLLNTLGFSQNQITYMDLSDLTLLEDLSASNNNLSYLNIQNSNNINLQDFDATGNPNLFCIQVDDVTFMTNNFGSYIDATASFSLNCGTCVVSIPDAAFKNALLGNPAINTNANSEIECIEAINFSDTIFVTNLGINDLTGIEFFTSIKGLVCNQNNLINLDLSSNYALLFVHCYDNQINNINVYNCAQLNKLWCSNNDLDYIDVSNNYVLEELACFNNNFTSIDVSYNPSLRDFRCSYNQLSYIDVTYNPALELLYCGNNVLNSIDLYYNSLLIELDCGPNQLSNLDLTNNLMLEVLEAGNNQLTTLDLSNNAALTVIYCNLNQLTQLRIDNGNNINLTAFSALNNPDLTCIQVDDPTFMINNWNASKPSPAFYSDDCVLGSCPPLPLSFSAADVSLTTSPMTATFTNNTPNPSNYNFVWYFGDGSMLADNNNTVSHTYFFNGIYTVSLVAIDINNGCSDTLVNFNYITCNSGTAMSCNHTVTLNPSGVINACNGSVVPLNSSTSIANPVYQWNKNGVIISGASQNQMYANSNGNYTLTVFNALGCPVTSSPTQINYSLQSSAAPTISATGPANTCGDVNVTLTASGTFTNYLWSNGQTGNSITVTQGGSYSVTGQSPACDAVSWPVLINGSNAPIPPICMITVDETDNKNVVIWEKPVSNEIDSFLVLREDINNPGIYSVISAQSYVDLSEFKDLSSDANARAYRYKLAVKDTCGGISIPSEEQRSMHLDVAQGNSILARQLNWNVYQGQPQGYTHYLIFRETAPGNLNLSLIDSVPSIQTWYYDNSLTAIADTNRAYMVGYRITTPCVSSRAGNQICQSNVTSIEMPVIDGLNSISQNDFDFNIIPNPNNGIFRINVIGNQSHNALKMNIINVLGEQVYSKNFDDIKQMDMDLRSLANGVYFVCFKDGMNNIQKRVIIAK